MLSLSSIFLLSSTARARPRDAFVVAANVLCELGVDARRFDTPLVRSKTLVWIRRVDYATSCETPLAKTENIVSKQLRTLG